MDGRLSTCAAARVCVAQLAGGVCLCMLRGPAVPAAVEPIATAELDGLGAE